MTSTKKGLLYFLTFAAAAAAAAASDTTLTLPPTNADELGQAAALFSGPVEVVATSSDYDFHWLESPIWSESGQYLLFSDVKWKRPDNGLVCGMIWKYDDTIGNVTELLKCSGLAGPPGVNAVDGLPDDIADRSEGGSNGLALMEDGTLLVNQHGWKRMVKMNVDDIDESTASVAPELVTVVVDSYNGTLLNSPNDMILAGDSPDMLYFTDPPFGLQYNNVDDPFAYSFELMTQDAPAVYRYTFGREGEDIGQLERILQYDVDEDWSQRSGPNGVAVNEKNGDIAVVITDWNDPRTEIYPRNADGSYGPEPTITLQHEYRIEGELSSFPALADGTTYDRDLGVLIVSAPGGIYIYDTDDDYNMLGFIRINDLCSNNVFGGGYLWFTCNQRLLRVPLSNDDMEPAEETLASMSNDTGKAPDSPATSCGNSKSVMGFLISFYCVSFVCFLLYMYHTSIW